MTQDQIIGMSDDDFILVTDGKHPYRGKKLRYYLDSRFAQRANMKSFATREAQVEQLPSKIVQIETKTWMKDADLAKLERLFELPPKDAVEKVKKLMLEARKKPKQLTSDAQSEGEHKPQHHNEAVFSEGTGDAEVAPETYDQDHDDPDVPDDGRPDPRLGW